MQTKLKWAVLLLLGHGWAASNPHWPEGSQDLVCLDCHVAQPPALTAPTCYVLPEAVELRRPIGELCNACHDDAESGHEVDVEVDFSVPSDLPLENGKLTCLTCHCAHSPLRDTRPWASASVLDRFFDPERLHKTFLLRRNNAEGELCLVCHAVEE